MVPVAILLSCWSKRVKLTGVIVTALFSVFSCGSSLRVYGCVKSSFSRSFMFLNPPPVGFRLLMVSFRASIWQPVITVSRSVWRAVVLCSTVCRGFSFRVLLLVDLSFVIDWSATRVLTCELESFLGSPLSCSVVWRQIVVCCSVSFVMVMMAASV